jgi:hypothetical protein
LSDLKPVSQYDFSKGENTVASPYLLRPDQVQQAVNFLLDEHGSLRVRDGTLIQNSKSPNAARPIVKLWDLQRNTGAIDYLAIQAGVNSASPNSLYRRDSNPWGLIGNFTTYSLIPDIINFTGLAIFANSNTEVLRSFDGTTFAALVGAPNGQHIANHLNFLWAWNTSPTTNIGTAVSPSSLQSSDLNNSGSWPGANQTYIARDDGQTGQGLANYTIAEAGISPTATLITWKDFSGYECTNPFGTTFSVQKVKSDMGCVAPRSSQFISGFGVIRLTHRGFSLYDGVNDTLISEEERPRIFGRDQYNGLDWAQISHSMATQCANPPLYICACPTSGPTLTRVFIYDLVRRAWTVLNFPNNLATLQLILDAGSLPTVLGGDWDQGYVRRYFMGDKTNDGTVTNWLVRTRAYTAGTPSERAYWRRLLLTTYGFPAGSQISVTFYPSPISPVQSKTVTKTIPTVTAISPFLGFGLDPFGTSPFGASIEAIEDTVLEFPMGFKANNVQVQLAGSVSDTATTLGKIRGIELHARAMPLTKSTFQGA